LCYTSYEELQTDRLQTDKTNKNYKQKLLMVLLLAIFFVILRADFIQNNWPQDGAPLVLADQPLDSAAFMNIN